MSRGPTVGRGRTRASSGSDALVNARTHSTPTEGMRPRLTFRHLQELIDCDGEISVGHRHGIGIIAAASDESRCHVMLVARKGERLTALLKRLDLSLKAAMDADTSIDEVNR